MRNRENDIRQYYDSDEIPNYIEEFVDSDEDFEEKIAENVTTDTKVTIIKVGSRFRIAGYRRDEMMKSCWLLDRNTERIVDNYLDEFVFDARSFEEELEYDLSIEFDDDPYGQEIEDEIYLRETTIDDAFDSMLEDLLGMEQLELLTLQESYEDVRETTKEIVCRMLAEKYKLDIYRPMWESNEESNELELQEFPYNKAN